MKTPLYIDQTRKNKPFPFVECAAALVFIIAAVVILDYNGIINIAKYLK